MACIICNSVKGLDTVEHIVNESLVNYHYTMDSGSICKSCNNRFSKFEGKALSQTMLGMERARFAIISKKGKATKGKSGHITFQGSKDFKKYVISLEGITEDDIEDFDPKTGRFKLKVKGFDDSNAAVTAKLALKIGIESIYKSQRKIFKAVDFSDLKEHLLSGQTRDWPFLISRRKIHKFKSVARFTDKHELKKYSCSLEYAYTENGELLFRFRYGGVTIVINLSSRDMSWAKDYMKEDSVAQVYPRRFDEKLRKSL